MQEEIETCRKKEALLLEAAQPRLDEALALSSEADSHLSTLKEYEAFAQEKIKEYSAEALQDIVDKEKAADELYYRLSQQYKEFIEKAKQQGVPGWDTSKS